MNNEKFKLYHRTYYLKHGVEIRNKYKLWYQNNKAKVIEINNNWKLRNLDKVKEYQKLYHREWYSNNKDRLKEMRMGNK